MNTGHYVSIVDSAKLVAIPLNTDGYVVGWVGRTRIVRDSFVNVMGCTTMEDGAPLRGIVDIENQIPMEIVFGKIGSNGCCLICDGSYLKFEDYGEANDVAVSSGVVIREAIKRLLNRQENEE